MIEYFSNHHDHFLFILAAIFLIIDVVLLGISGFLLFIALGCAITGLLVSTSLVAGIELEIFIVGMMSLLSALILWKPLKKFQNNTSESDNSSDMIGIELVASEDITRIQGSVRYSGINWNARLSPSADVECIPKNQLTIITSIKGSTLFVEPA